MFTPVQLCLTGGPAVSGGTRSALSVVISGARTSSDYTTADLWTASLSHCVFSFVYLSQQQAQRLLWEIILYAGIVYIIFNFPIQNRILFAFLFYSGNQMLELKFMKLKIR